MTTTIATAIATTAPTGDRDVVSPAPLGRPSRTPRRPRVTPGRVSALVGIGAFLLVVVGNAVPSVWYDEAATIVSARRTLAQLGTEVQHVDAVHALYYLGMHGWFELVGYSPFTLRLPSAVAVGLTAALLVRLVGAWRGLRAGALAGVVFALIPRVDWAGGEGRSFAIATLLAVVVTAVLLRAIADGRRRWWAVYAGVVVISAFLFVYLLLVVAAHGAALAALALGGRLRFRRGLAPWMLVALAAALPILPFFVVLITQGGQIGWVEQLGPHTLRGVFRGQWFGGSAAVATVAWLLIAAGAARTLRRIDTAGAVVLAGLLVPTIALVLATAVYQPLYSPRYLVISTPFVAALIARALDRPLPRGAAIAAVVAVAALSAPVLVAARQPDAKQDSTWSSVARLVAQEAADHQDGVAIIYGPVRYHPKATTRVISYAYPDAFSGTLDVTLLHPAGTTAGLWESRGHLANGVPRIIDAHPGTVLLITSVKRDRREATAETMAAIGWVAGPTRTIGDVNVVEYRRGPAAQG